MSSFIKGVMILYKKELKDTFFSPLVYILAGLFCLLMGWLFFNYLMLSKEMTASNLTNAVLTPIFGNMNFIFLFLSPLLTMRLLSEERKLHSLELLFLSDLNHTQIILGKFFSALTAIVFMLSLNILFPIILSVSGYSDWGVVLGSYLGIILSVCCYLSVGLFASSLTENQIVAAVVGFCILLGLMLLVLSANATNNYMLGQIFQYLAPPFHYESFVRGAVRNYNLVYFGSFVGFFFFLTHKSLESRSW